MSLRIISVLFAAAVLAAAGVPQGNPVSIGSVAASRSEGAGTGHAKARPGVASRPPPPVPQTHSRPGEKGYRLAPAWHMNLPATHSTKQPFFRGGSTSRTTAGPATTSAARAPLTLSPGTPTLYNGLNKAGMAADGTQTPPDSTGAIGPNNYVEMDNSNIAVYDRSLNHVSTVTLDNFIGAPSSFPFCDPQVQWDPTANRWLIAYLYCNISSSTQRIVIAWSKTADPSNLLANNTGVNPGTGGWCAFSFVNDPYLFDYPKLGHNATYLIVGGNLYDESSPTPNPLFISAAMEWAPLPASSSDTSCKAPASSGSTNIPLHEGNGVTLAYTPVPVNNTTNAADDYVISAYDAGGNFGAVVSRITLSVWRLDAAGVLHAANDLTVNTYSMPTSAQQPGSTDTIDTLDGRLTQAVGDPTTGIYTQHTVLSGSVSQVDWYEITASGDVAALAQQGSIAIPSVWVFNAAISPRADGQGAAIFYTTSASGVTPTVNAKIRRPSTAVNTFEAGSLPLASSSAADTDFSCNDPNPGIPCRWGDYSGASPDPVQTNVVWGTSEINTAAGSTPAWADQNYAVYAALRPQAPVSVTAAASGSGDALVTWTPSSFDPGAPITGYEIFAYVGLTLEGHLTLNGAGTSAVFSRLTRGVTYAFGVVAMNAVGLSPQSPLSNALTFTGGVSQSTASPPPRDTVNPSTPSSPQPR